MTDTLATSTRFGSLAELEKDGRLLGKVGSLPVVVVWHEGRAYAIEDRCPHLGFPLHQGTVEAGLVTCHWHHARFDLVSGCTLDPWADDAQGFDVELARRRRARAHPRTGRPGRAAAAAPARRARGGHHARDRQGGARAARGAASPARDRAHRRRVRHAPTAPTAGARGSPCSSRWRTCSRSSIPTTRRSRSCTRLAFVSRDTRGRAPRFPIEPLRTDQRRRRTARGLVPALRRDPRRGRGRAGARDRARRPAPLSPRSRR